MAEGLYLARVDGQGPYRAELEVTQESVDVSPINGVRVPNMAWEFVDEAGHYHSWTKDEMLPTLDRHTNLIPCAHGHEDEEYECGGHEVVVTVCRICSEEIEPAYVLANRQMIPGLSYWNAWIFGVYLDMGSRVSVSFVATRDAPRVRHFGVAKVVAHEITQGSYVTRLHGDGPLGNKR